MAIAELRFITQKKEHEHRKVHLDQAKFISSLNPEQRHSFELAAKIFQQSADRYSPRRFWNFKLPVQEVESKLTGILH